jgi:hypothetical protein
MRRGRKVDAIDPALLIGKVARKLCPFFQIVTPDIA